MRLSDAVRERLREEMARQNLSQRDAAQLLNWSQSRIAKLLTGRIQLDIDDVEAFSTVLNVRPTELVRDRGLEFAAEMTPTELRVLERLRALPKPTYDAFITLLDLRGDVEPRGATKRKPIFGPSRPR